MKKKEKNLVVQSNELIRSKSSLTKIQTKLILKAISLIGKGESDINKYYDISISEFASEIDYSSNSYSKELTELAKGIVGKPLVINLRDESVLFTTWASSIVVDKKSARISIRFDEALKPYLLELKRFFSSYDLKNILLLKSQTSIRLYQLLRQYLNLGIFQIDLEDLKKILGSKTSMYGKFHQRILLPCQKDIHKKTDICFSFVPIKTGRKVTALKFKIKQKISNEKSKVSDKSTKEIFDELDEKEKLSNQERARRKEEVIEYKKYLESLPKEEKKLLMREIRSQFGKDLDLKIWTYFKKKETITQ
ncbi:hypothetical protein AB834_02880 [PVC group bacterium (ex Bugula neritina AB1)]|nr:hypothetical protein AB834_02880 [PVC group bacterium (ex Bugula neritina AB1)]